MKKVILFCFFGILNFMIFASFPVEGQLLIADTDPEVFKLDIWGFIIGILTTPFFLLFAIPLLLLLINKKNFRKSLFIGWLVGLLLLVLIIIASTIDFMWLY